MSISDGRAFGISVIIPSFNRPVSTGRAVRSALSQSHQPLEVIVVDDGSSPPLTCNNIGVNDARLRIFRFDVNRGASAARQFGVDVARGDILAFLDSDDVWLPHKLAIQVDLLQATGPVAVASGWTAIPEYAGIPEIVIPKESGQPSDFAAGCWFAPGSTLLVPRRVFDSVGPFNPELRRLEDYEWFLRFARGGGRLVVVPKVAAIISMGCRGRLDAVRRAKTIIEDALRTKHHPIPTRRFLRLAKAYLFLEMAKASQNEGRHILMASYMLCSLFLEPRFQPALRRWWTTRCKITEDRGEADSNGSASPK